MMTAADDGAGRPRGWLWVLVLAVVAALAAGVAIGLAGGCTGEVSDAG